MLQAAIGFGEAFGEVTVQLGLMPALLRETIDDHGSKKEKHDAQGEEAESLGSQFVFLHRGVEIGAIESGGDEGPEQCQPWSAVERGRDDRDEINRPVTAVDSDFVGVIEKQGCQQNLEQDDVEDSALGEAGDQL